MSEKKGPVATTGPEDTRSQSIAVRPVEQVALATLASEIESGESAGMMDFGNGLGHFRRVGQLLLEAKQDCPRGEWLTWLDENVKFSRQTATAYMRLAERWGEVAAAQLESQLSITECLKLLAPPKPETEPEPLPLPFGFVPAKGKALVGLDNEKRILVVASESTKHPGYWLMSALGGRVTIPGGKCEFDLVAYKKPINVSWMMDSLGILLEESDIEPEELEWLEVTAADVGSLQELQDLSEDDAAFVAGAA